MLAEKAVKQLQHVRVLAEHNIIGITTTGCASRWELLRDLKPEILLCEEAGEVLEPHALCSLLPSLQHAIFIGDPLQLRPTTNEQMMTLETKTGSKYRLDESLFERIMTPRDPAAIPLPTSQLNIQRRMHPHIADFTRMTYRFLRDHEDTHSHEFPKGIRQRFFWLDHRVPEMIEPEVSDSVCNPYEAEMIKGLVEYLLRGNCYSLGEIAVLTPYAAQLTKLRQALQSTCSVWLSKKDRETLIDNGQLDMDLEHATGKITVTAADMVRIATIDNFQGEEAKIVILSTVRSGGKPGFLKTENRINVACSRARDSFIIIGNAETLAKVDMWKNIVTSFDEAGSLGSGLDIRCDRHPYHHSTAYQPFHFEAFRPCPSVCDITLSCGHICGERCHDAVLHDIMSCSNPCEKLLPCGHTCQNLCGEQCGPCNHTAEPIILECCHGGHRFCSGKVTECSQVVEERNLLCGRHTVEVICGDTSDNDQCASKCGMYLSCGHECPGRCTECQSISKHQQCVQICQKTLPCGHKCAETCHHEKACPPCEQVCEERCAHGQCKHICSKPCEPCLLEQFPACEHEKTPAIICALPNIVAPCASLCPNILECGHYCTSLHNEVCPSKAACLKCKTPGQPVPKVLYNPACGHSFEIKQSDNVNLGGLFTAGSTFESNLEINHDATIDDLQPPTCPICTCKLSAHRYDTITRLIQLPEIVDHLVLRVGTMIHQFAETVQLQDALFQRDFKYIVEKIRPSSRAAESNTQILLARDQKVQDIHHRIVTFKDQSGIPLEEHLAKLNETWPNIVPEYQLMFRLHLNAVEYRAAYMSIMDKIRTSDHLLSIQDHTDELQRQALVILEIAYANAISNMLYCERTAMDHRLKSNPSLDAEIRLHQIQFRLSAYCTFQYLRAVKDKKELPRMCMGTSGLRKSLEKVEWIAARYPSTCTPFFGSVPKFRAMLDDLEKEPTVEMSSAKNLLTYHTSIPSINSANIRSIERSWSQHSLGSLVVCQFQHPYSTKTFPAGCPECGKQEITKEERKVNEERNNAAFLASIRR